MKKYPRIYSLSTIGIIHHQKNDTFFIPIVLILLVIVILAKVL